jgi:hypothetical protein
VLEEEDEVFATVVTTVFEIEDVAGEDLASILALVAISLFSVVSGVF